MKRFTTPQISWRNRKFLSLWPQIWIWLSYGMLATASVISLLDESLTLEKRLACLVIALIYGTWYWVFVVRHDRWGRRSPWLGLSFVAIIGLLYIATGLHMAFSMLLFSMYGVLFGALDMIWAIPNVMVVSLAISVRLILLTGEPVSANWGIIIGFTFTTFFSILLGLYINSIYRQSWERQRMIDELQETRGELAAAERQAGILQERQRLAREIHDTLAQGFTSIVVHLEAADQALPGGEELGPARRHLDQARRTARESLEEARRFVWALHPEPLERETLAPAIRRAVERWSEESKIRGSLEISGDPRLLPSAYEVTLLRAAQEALANIRKHARASQVNLTLTYMDDQVILDVQDNGIGFDYAALSAEQPGQGGFGLMGMRERIQQLGGSLLVESAPGEGTTLVIELPFQPARPEMQPNREGA